MQARHLAVWLTCFACASCGAESQEPALAVDQAASEQSPDAAFLRAMIPHHAAAVQMAELELAKGELLEVKVMARGMLVVQKAEIDEMQSIYRNITGIALAAVVDDRHYVADLALLSELEGIELDAAFLEHMVPHHADAIVMSHNALARLRLTGVRKMAARMLASQARETGDMQRMLDRIDRPSPIDPRSAKGPFE